MRAFAALLSSLALVIAPQASLAQAHAAPVAASQTVPFEFLQERQILFPIRINGQAAEAWLDSGASATVVDAAFARTIGLELGQSVRAEGVGGEVQGVRLARAQVQVGAVTVPAGRVAVMDLSHVATVTPRPVQVILGREVFQDAIVQIDFPRRELTFFRREGFVAPSAVQALPLKANGSLRSFPVRIDGVPTQAILDLGNAGALLLDRAFVERKGLLKNRRSSTQLAVGADGPMVTRIASFDHVQVGGVSFHGVNAVAVDRLASHAPANVGLEILSRFRVTVDFAGERLWLEPRTDAAEATFRKNRSGLSVAVAKDRLRVTHVAEGSPAAAAGWREGEEVTAVDGQPVTPEYGVSPLARWIFRPAGTPVDLTLADGSHRRLVLADYF